MKLCFFVLLLAGPFVVRSQAPLSLLRAGEADTALLRLLSTTQQKVRVMAPDLMSCWVPDPGRVERMPVSRRQNADKMPNPLAARKKEEK